MSRKKIEITIKARPKTLEILNSMLATNIRQLDKNPAHRKYYGVTSKEFIALGQIRNEIVSQMLAKKDGGDNVKG